MTRLRAMFRLTSSPGINLLLVLLWWPYAAVIYAVVWVLYVIAQVDPQLDEAAQDSATELPVGDADRRVAVDAVTRRLTAGGVITDAGLQQLADLATAIRAAKTRGELAAVAGVPLVAFGPLKAGPGWIPVRWKRPVPLVAATFGVALMVAGGITQEFGVAALGSLSIMAAVAVWTWRKARRSKVWKTLGFGFLAWLFTIIWAAAIAPPVTPDTGPRLTSWREWCTTYSNADGSLKVGPQDIRPAVLAAERLPVPADLAAAAAVRSAVAQVGSDARSYAGGNSHKKRFAAEDMTRVAVTICKPLLGGSVERPAR